MYVTNDETKIKTKLYKFVEKIGITKHLQRFQNAAALYFKLPH